MALADKVFKLIIDMDARKAKRGAAEAETAMTRLGRRISAIAPYATLAGAAMGAMFVRSSIQKAIEQEQALKAVESQIRATGGAAGVSAGQMAQWASELQRLTGIGDEVTLRMGAMLLSFKQIQGEVLQDTMRVAQDVATIMGGDMQTAALMLAKALADPVARLGELSRSGVVFTQSQKDMVKAMVESGRLLEAQKFILAEIESQYGGAAAAARDTLGGALRALSAELGDLQEKIILNTNAMGPLREAVESLVDVLQYLNGTFDETISWFDLFYTALGKKSLGKQWADTMEDAFGALPDWLVGSQQAMRGLGDEVKRTQDEIRKFKTGELEGALSASAKKTLLLADSFRVLHGLMPLLVQETERFGREKKKLVTASDLMDRALANEIKRLEELDKAAEPVVEQLTELQKLMQEFTSASYERKVEMLADVFGRIADSIEEVNRAAAEMRAVLGGTVEALPESPLFKFEDLATPEQVFGAIQEPGFWNKAGAVAKDQLTPAFMASFSAGIIQALANGDTQRALEQGFAAAFAVAGAAVGGAYGGPAGAQVGAQIGSVVGAILGSIISGGGPGQTKAVFGFGPGSTLDASGQRLEQFNRLLQELNRTFAELEHTINGTIELTNSFEIAIKENGEAWLRLYDQMGNLISSTPFESFEQALTAGLEHVMSSAIVNAAGPVGDAIAELFSMATERGFDQTMQDIETVAGAFQLIDDALGNFTLTGDAVLSQLDDLRFSLSQMGLSAEALAPILDRIAAAEEERMTTLRQDALGRLYQMALDAGLEGAKLAQKRAKLEQAIYQIQLAKLRAELKMLGIFEGFVKNLFKRLKKWADDIGNFAVDVGANLNNVALNIGRVSRGLGRRAQYRQDAAAARGGIVDFLTGMGFGGTSALGPGARFALAQQQFAEIFDLARGGNLSALQNITGFAQTLLQEGRAFYGSSEGFGNLFFEVNRMLSSLVGGKGSLSDLRDSVEVTAAKQLGVQESQLTTQQRMLREIQALRKDMAAVSTDARRTA